MFSKISRNTIDLRSSSPVNLFRSAKFCIPDKKFLPIICFSVL